MAANSARGSEPKWRAKRNRFARGTLHRFASSVRGLIPIGRPPRRARFHISQEDCDLIASDINANCNFFATIPDESENAGEFVPDFNIFHRIMATATGRTHAQQAAN